jgi:hypothetical protein
MDFRAFGTGLLQILTLTSAWLAQEQNQTQGPEQQARRHPRHSHLYIGTIPFNPLEQYGPRKDHDEQS